MIEELKKYILPTLIGISAYILKELHGAFKQNTNALSELRLTMVELKVKVEALTMQITPVAKIKADLDAVHEKIRKLSPEKA
jgi:hypothetical protein